MMKLRKFPAHHWKFWKWQPCQNLANALMQTWWMQVGYHSNYFSHFEDVVIATYQLLKNPRYFRIGNSAENASNPHAGEEVKRYAWIKSLLEVMQITSTSHIRQETRKSKKGESQKGPPLEHFYWYRLIVDEGHEVINDLFYYSMEIKWISLSFHRNAGHIRC